MTAPDYLSPAELAIFNKLRDALQPTRLEVRVSCLFAFRTFPPTPSLFAFEKDTTNSPSPFRLATIPLPIASTSLTSNSYPRNPRQRQDQPHQTNAQPKQVQDISGGCGSMYGLDVVSPRFAGLSVIRQHKLVNAVLADDIKGWHGVQLKTRAP